MHHFAVLRPTALLCAAGLYRCAAPQGRQYILKVLEDAVIRSKAAIRSGKEPACLLDFWTQQLLTECDEAAAAGTPAPKYSTNKEMAYVVMDFLFASQVGQSRVLEDCQHSTPFIMSGSSLSL